MKNYKQSKNWDMDITLEELISSNATCKIDLDSAHHFETYEGVLVYVSHPSKEEKNTIESGICEDGIMYEGDYGCQDKFKEIPIEEGLDILVKYGELLDTRHNFEYLLLKNNLDKDVVRIVIK